MKRSNAYSFKNVPVVRHKRSKFDLSHRVLTSGNTGTLYPFEVQEIYPGDSFKCETTIVSRLASSFVKPIMDNLFMDVYYFFVPARLCYDKFPNVFGENTDSAWANQIEYKVPRLVKTTNDSYNSVIAKSVADYMGLPIAQLAKGDNIPSILPFRAFAKIYDEWFRDENIIPPMHIQKGATGALEYLNGGAWSPSNYTGMCPKVARMHDYFSSCLPAPQKGSAVDLPLALTGDIPVVPGISNVPNSSLSGAGLRFVGNDGSSLPNANYPFALMVEPTYKSLIYNDYNLQIGGDAGSAIPVNLWARANGTTIGSGLSVNELRFAFQFQKMLERDARGGSRYVEYLMNAYGVSAGDSRLQRSEFLGGRRMPISITQVTQTTGFSDDAQTPQTLGQLGAYSLSGGKSRYSKSFTEHGFVIGVFAIRQFHTYSQGVQRFWMREKRTDFYDPVFQNIGEQPVYKREIFADNTTMNDGSIFGYQEAWADLRQTPNRLTSEMRSNYDVWHLGDKYANAPVLNQTFIEESPDNVDRVITVDSSSADQFIIDIYLNVSAIRCLSTYSVPSLIDHN